ncbi:MAG: proline--tRNA ligase, partial [Gemmatimonadota bacterium]
DEMQQELLEAAIRRREENSYRGVTDYEEFKRITATTGGFIFTGYCGAEKCEARVKEDTKASVRLIPDEDFASETYPERCICGGKALQEVVWARAY